MVQALPTHAGAWYLSGGISAANCIAAYQPIGAADLATSYVNLANPGTYDATPGSAPTFNVATGWEFDGAGNYLLTGLVPSCNQTWSWVIRLSNLGTTTLCDIFGGVNYFDSPGCLFGLSSSGDPTSAMAYANGGLTASLVVAPVATSGVLGTAGRTPYRNGAADGVDLIPEDSSADVIPALIIGGINTSEGAAATSQPVKIQAFAIYNTTLTPTQMIAVQTAMALLPGGTATTIDTNWAASSHTISRKVEVQWDGTNWVDETAYALSYTARVGVTSNGINGLPMFGGGSPASGTVTLSNDTGRFSVRNSGGALYSYIQYGMEHVRIRISAGYVDDTYGAEQIVIFTGYIYVPTEQELSGGSRTVTLELRGNETDIMQGKQSSSLYKNTSIHSFMALILTNAGITDRALDNCLIPINYLWVDDENTWEECLRLAQAELCLFWVTETGMYNLRRLSTLVERTASTTSQLTLNRGNAFRLDAQRAAMNAYERVVVEVGSMDEGAAETVYTCPETFEIPASSSKTIYATYDTAIWQRITPVKNTDWYAVTAGVQDISSNVTLTSRNYAQRSEFTFTNANTTQAAFIYGFQVRGYPVIAAKAHDISASADHTTLVNYWRVPADDDFIVASANMKVGAYTIANARPVAPRGGTATAAGVFNLMVTVTATGTADTMGTLAVVGLSILGGTITETIVPVAGQTVISANEYSSITSITGAGWVISGAGSNDTIKVGYRLAAFDKTIRITGNPYIQTDQQAQLVAAMACQWLKIPRTLIQWTGPDAPWLQACDRVTVTDANSGINEDGWILDAQRKGDGTSQTLTLLIIPCANLFAHSTYFIVGTNAYKNSGSGYCFY